MRKFIVLIAVTAVACGGNVTAPQSEADYPVAILDTASAFMYTDFAAELQSAQVVEIRPRVSGYIDKITVLEGSHVTKGQLIMQINQDDLREDYNAALANVDAAKAKVDNAKLEVRKLAPLVQKGIISPFEIENAQSNLDAANAQYTSAQSGARNAQISLSYASITSPVNGVVGRIVVREGTLVSPTSTEPLTTVSGDGPVSAYFSIDENSMLEITENMRGPNLSAKVSQIPNVSLIMSNDTIYEYAGVLELASGLVDMTTGSVQVKGIFPNPEGFLRTGSSARVRLGRMSTGAIVVPQKATYELQDKTMVYKVDGNGVVTSQKISLDGKAGLDYVVEEGLKIGDTIVLEGLEFLKDGEKIKIK